jgi:hypothetical protein
MRPSVIIHCVQAEAVGVVEHFKKIATQKRLTPSYTKEGCTELLDLINKLLGIFRVDFIWKRGFPADTQ